MAARLRSPPPTATRRLAGWRRYAALSTAASTGGTRLLSAAGVDRAREGQGSTVDVVLGIGSGGRPSEWALGYILSGEEGLLGPNANAFGHGGYGGSFRSR
jgi:hypothetical protein